MGCRVDVVHVRTGPAGWEVEHRGEVLYWGPGVRRALAEAERFAELFSPAVVVVDGAGVEPADDAATTWGFG